MAGFVYVATNKYMPGLVKIGFTDRDPITHRVPELFQTGVPSPFKTKYHAFVNEPRSLERKLHSAFSDVRAEENREFFKTSVTEVYHKIQQLTNAGEDIKFEQKAFVPTKEYTNAIYEGDLTQDNRENGIGKLYYDDGDTYEGEFKDGYKHGTGTLTFSNGKIWSGNFYFDMFMGQGEITDPSGWKYKGEVLSGKPHGFGRKSWDDGDFHEGNWLDGEPVGKGKRSCTWSDQEISYSVEGIFEDWHTFFARDHKYYRDGTLQDHYRGELNGEILYEGLGQLIWTDSDKISKQVGLHNPDGYQEWQTTFYKDNSYYTGEMQDYEWSGRGVYVSDHYILAGNFDESEEGMPLPAEVQELTGSDATKLTEGMFIDLKTTRGMLISKGYGAHIKGLKI